ncbi:MAG: CRISPR-associated endonuclease Cas2 [Actinomycetota bacterium]
MSRRRYLIAYDISDPRRLRRVIKVMESFGTRLQYSVFLCDLSGMELSRWQGEILDVVRLSEDSVVYIDLGAQGASARVNVLGVPRVLPRSGPTIV